MRDPFRIETRPVTGFALLGALSGSLAGVVLLAAQNIGAVESLGGVEVLLTPGSVVPGLTFGLIVGFALRRFQRIGVGRLAAYAAASAVSYYAAFMLAVRINETWLSLTPTGLIAGLFGSACLTGISAILFPFVRQPRPVLLMLTAGCLLGGALELINYGFWGTLLFFALWQAGYAAAFATALPKTTGEA